MIQAATLSLHPILTWVSPGPPEPQEQTPVDGPYSEVGIKPQLSSRGRVTKEEEKKKKKKAFHQLQNPHIQLNGVCVYRIYKQTMTVPTKEDALSLAAVDIGGKHTWEHIKIRV